MVGAVTGGVGHPVVAALVGLAAAGLAGMVVAMAWNVHVRQFRLAELLARRQAAVTAGPDQDTTTGAGAPDYVVNGTGHREAALDEVVGPAGGAGPGGVAGPAGPGLASPVVIDGPDTVLIGEQARYRARLPGGGTVVSWAVGGGAVSQAPDPAHPDELLLTADQAGDLTVIVRVRKGLAERRATKVVTAEEGATVPAPPFTLQLFLQGWPLVVVAVLVVGLAGALVTLGSFTSADFIAVALPLIALLGMAAVVLGAADAPGRSGRGGRRTARVPRTSGTACQTTPTPRSGPGRPRILTDLVACDAMISRPGNRLRRGIGPIPHREGPERDVPGGRDGRSGQELPGQRTDPRRSRLAGGAYGLRMRRDPGQGGQPGDGDEHREPDRDGARRAQPGRLPEQPSAGGQAGHRGDDRNGGQCDHRPADLVGGLRKQERAGTAQHQSVGGPGGNNAVQPVAQGVGKGHGRHGDTGVGEPGRYREQDRPARWPRPGR